MLSILTYFNYMFFLSCIEVLLIAWGCNLGALVSAAGTVCDSQDWWIVGSFLERLLISSVGAVPCVARGVDGRAVAAGCGARGSSASSRIGVNKCIEVDQTCIHEGKEYIRFSWDSKDIVTRALAATGGIVAFCGHCFKQ